MRLVPPGNSSKEIVKVKVERCVGTRSFEVVTEDGARYRRNSPSHEENKGGLPES